MPYYEKDGVRHLAITPRDKVNLEAAGYTLVPEPQENERNPNNGNENPEEVGQPAGERLPKQPRAAGAAKAVRVDDSQR